MIVMKNLNNNFDEDDNQQDRNQRITMSRALSQQQRRRRNTPDTAAWFLVSCLVAVVAMQSARPTEAFAPAGWSAPPAATTTRGSATLPSTRTRRFLPNTGLSYANTADPPLPPSSAEEQGNNNNNMSFEERMRRELRLRAAAAAKAQQQQQQKSQPTTNTEKQRQLNQFFGGKKRQQSSRQKQPFIHQVSTLAEFQALVQNEHDDISVVRFYSPTCRSCKAATPAWHAVARKYQQNKGQLTTNKVNFINVAVTRHNVDLHQALQVTSVPFGHIYVPEGYYDNNEHAGETTSSNNNSKVVVEKLRMIRPRMEKFDQILQSYVHGSCQLPRDVDPETGVYESPFK